MISILSSKVPYSLKIFPYSVEYPDKPPTTWKLIANMLWRFTHQIRSGDVVIARRGRKQLAVVGDVMGPAYYARSKNPAFPDHHVSYQWASPAER